MSDSSDDDYQNDIENINQNYNPRPFQSWQNPDQIQEKDENTSSDQDGLKFDDLKQSLMEKDSQLLKFRSKNENILRQYKEAQEELEQCHEQIARQAALIHEQSYKLEEANRRVSDISQNHSQLVQKSRVNVSSYQNELELKDQEILKLRQEINSREDKIVGLYEALDGYKERIEDLMREIKYKEEDQLRLKHK